MNFNNETVAHEGRARKSQSTKTSKKLQLWTNQSKTKYAISFENDLRYLAKTDPDVMQYTTVIAESDTIFKGYEYDWKYILKKWINNHKFATGFKNRSKFFLSYKEDIPKIKNTPSNAGSKSSFYATTLDGKKYSVRLKSYIKCHFCKLLFDTKNKRTGHERAWHTKK